VRTQAAVLVEVRALAHLDLPELRERWRLRFGVTPRLRSRELLAQRLAWELQAETFGGLDADISRRLRRGVGLLRPRSDLGDGVRLTREWGGRPHEVKVVEDGYLYAGATYRSLSKVAGVITGGKWNGRRFFGLDGQGGK
jgi:hypothetical protein